VLTLRDARLTSADMNCAGYLAAVAAGDDGATYARWLAGYLQGLAERDGTVTPDVDFRAEDQAGWLRTYCSANDDSTMADAARAFAAERHAIASGKARR